jgi:hypothetical protein
MKTINETYPQIKVGTILTSKEQIKYKVTHIFDHTIQVTTNNNNPYSFNTTDIKQMKLKIYE